MLTGQDLVVIVNLVFLVPAALLGIAALAIGGAEMTAIIRRKLHLS